MLIHPRQIDYFRSHANSRRLDCRQNHKFSNHPSIATSYQPLWSLTGPATHDTRGQRNAKQHTATHGKLWFWKYYEFLLSQHGVWPGKEQGATLTISGGTFAQSTLISQEVFYKLPKMPDPHNRSHRSQINQNHKQSKIGDAILRAPDFVLWSKANRSDSFTLFY